MWAQPFRHDPRSIKLSVKPLGANVLPTLMMLYIMMCIRKQEAGHINVYHISKPGDFLHTGMRRDHSGVLELGGASAQIAFQHNGSILADKFPVSIRGEIYPLYVHSYLGFGQNMVQKRLDAIIFGHHRHQWERDGYITNPCMLQRKCSWLVDVKRVGAVRLLNYKVLCACTNNWG